MKESIGSLFPEELTREIKARFHHVDHDFDGKARLFFDNAGGSFRLKAATERSASVDAIPDCTERMHHAARHLQAIQTEGTDDFRFILNATGGTVFASLTASGAMFDMVRAIAENVPGTNLVTTTLEHPSSFDAVSYYAQHLNKELRVAKSNPVTGGIDVEDVVMLIDQNTCFLSVMYASNISGAKIDIKNIVRRARMIKPDLYVIVDAVQHAPHGVIDLEDTPVDALNIAPYKFFGCRGSGMSWLSNRAARLPHHKLNGKPIDFWDLGSSAPAQFAVITAIVDYVCWLGTHFTGATDRRARFVAGMHNIELHERALLSRMLDGSLDIPGLRRINGVKVLLDHPDLTKRDLIVATAFQNLSPADAVREYEKRGVVVYERVATSLYSRRMLDSFGIDGAIRVSPLHCHSGADIDQFLTITAQIAKL
ncbi:aminotransferase class V-fold PLP-dependent enzyme [Paraburkholderia kirstenboschensis]|uniref:Aminotransferase class V-fold PLP-dependent enzyme n=1 Tax=Paraburkholderia kirstenboschensis TaxID=1245436 RepID=A0ABZ0EK93_9BURK|nr:aminotransferase class V-fold PLP-dependent enzyme [Paraburkholderia kirstenboschensis]WOD17000.1 aminotransferase class V-fold PLP-dependent enzyme [Paraburkholderia kirstenboschensis]